MSAALPLRVVDAPEPDSDMVEMCEHYLTLAKAGQLNFLGVVVSYKDGCVSNGWVHRTTAHRSQVLGAISAMEYDFNQRVAQT